MWIKQWVSQRKDEDKAQLEKKCVGTEVIGICDLNHTAGQLLVPQSSRLRKVDVEQNLTGISLSRMKQRKQFLFNMRTNT